MVHTGWGWGWPTQKAPAWVFHLCDMLPLHILLILVHPEEQNMLHSALSNSAKQQTASDKPGALQRELCSWTPTELAGAWGQELAELYLIERCPTNTGVLLPATQ